MIHMNSDMKNQDNIYELCIIFTEFTDGFNGFWQFWIMQTTIILYIFVKYLIILIYKENAEASHMIDKWAVFEMTKLL